ncbi:ADAL family protein [Megaselia abdita]
MEDFIKKCPKVELHAHLNGSLSIETLQKLAIIKYGKSNSRFKELCDDFRNFEDHSMSECFQKFKFAHELTSTLECLREATLLAIKEFSEDNVVYLELRTTPKSTEEMSKRDYLENVLLAIKKASEDYPNILVKLLPSIDRSQGLDSAEEMFSLVLDFLEDDRFKDIIKGIDLSGNPTVGNFGVYKNLLVRAREASLKLALHCGEVENPSEITEMIEFGMDRCGHGTFISGENFELLKEKKIPVECCLSSNVVCGTVKNFNEHHFKRLLDANHPVVICTDDLGIFNSNLSSELTIAFNTFSLTIDDLRKVITNAVNCSFAAEEDKSDILKKIEAFFI